MSGDVFGIDLGTTYSAVAVINDLDQAEIVKNQNGEDTTPSVVYFDSGIAIVGAEAKSSLVTDADNGCALIKRHMGTVFPQEFAGQTYTPEAISGLILKELVSAANAQRNAQTAKAVITVPAYFGVKEKEATKQAGEMAGLEVIGILAEPIAAALSLGVRGEQRETILIYDLGGGTFDTTVMIAEPGNVEVVAVDGNRSLGGADWDEALAQLVIDKFREQAGLTDDPAEDPDFKAEILLDAEAKKKQLTRKQDATFRCRFEDADEKVLVTRAEFEAATAHLVKQTVEITQRVIETASAKSSSLAIDKLLLVGGSSRMPMVDEALKAAGFNPIPTDFDLSVAKGAAIYGQAILSGAVPFAAGDTSAAAEAGSGQEATNTEPKYFLGGAATLNIKNVLSRGIGVQFVREEESGALVDYVGFLVHANDPLPVVDTTLEAGTASDNQTGVRLRLYEQGGEVESEAISDNNLLKEAEISGLPPMPRGSTIELLLSVSSEGLATLSAREPVSGRELKMEAKISAQTPEEVEAGKELVGGLQTRS
ncbi:molecular chaperone DnaK [Mycolicibacterium conceptionense]|uniref:Hsp70 family protein n=1 Tax=Mycolicibacterium conceptionense TaxID=451644 RepID=UPI0007EC7303|nr:Hsp70 family protein [Mycolicibacterium conceptionense]OBJ98311.1 molecular chaperone DnaK [Mycolicibacterium conceptionense]OMB86002.1 molecular chaperone DnaK [Mycolicibacterium conceptionense]OMB99990.1 molecular chaperone DnaK [Mycolicibacterium conceptionense]